MAKLSEFSLIKQFFVKKWKEDANIICGMGDDAAVVQLSAKHRLVTSVDTLVSGIHFYPDMPPKALGYKVLAVNLSDLAAMGALPKWFTLALTIPDVNQDWLEHFSLGLFACAKKFNVTLIGGDTTRGPLSVTVQVLGELAEAVQPLLRSGAALGDGIYVSGYLGAAAAAVKQLGGEGLLSVPQACEDALYYPKPQIALGQLLVGQASSAIDISDGLVADLNHILEQSQGLGAELWQDKLPIHPSLLSIYSEEKQLDCVLYGGEDYQLCFTLSDSASLDKKKLAQYGVVQIGQVSQQSGVFLVYRENKKTLSIKGWQHF